MKELIVPKKLTQGDTVAFISLSGGRAGDEDMLKRYETGKKRFEETYGVRPIAQPGDLDAYTSLAIKKTLFETDIIGKVECSKMYTPMTVLPMGAMCEVNCETASFSILEPGVKA